jgi:hypothetical protein
VLADEKLVAPVIALVRFQFGSAFDDRDRIHTQ